MTDGDEVATSSPGTVHPRTAEQRYLDLVAAAGAALPSYGYRRRRATLARETDECWLLVAFEKSQWSTADRKDFYVNLGVAPKLWLRINDRASHKALSLRHCAAQARLGAYTPPPGRQQWTVSSAVDADALLLSELLDALRLTVVPILDGCATGHGLIAAPDKRIGIHRSRYLMQFEIGWLAEQGDTPALNQAVTAYQQYGEPDWSDPFLERMAELQPGFIAFANPARHR